MWEDDDDDDDGGYDPDEEQRKLEALPIYRKALEILDLTEQIVDTFNEEEAMAKMHGQIMLEDAMIIPAKIAGAEAMNDYILKMENATVIKIHARSLLTQTSSAKHLALQDPRYLKLLRDEIELFRKLFREWVATFEDGTTKDGDGWGLFVKDE